jgi:hypothetical protein
VDVKIKELSDVLRRVQMEAFIAATGCDRCRGRGWVVVWDTLDCMDGSMHESELCPDCGGAGRMTPGERVLSPVGLKHDKFHVFSVWEPVSPELTTLRKEREKVERELMDYKARWAVHAGCIVQAARDSRAKGALPRGIEARVVKLCNSRYDVKWYVVDRNGESFFPIEHTLEVIAPSNDEYARSWSQTDAQPISVRVTVRRLTDKAAFVELVANPSVQHWLPFSAVPGLPRRYGETAEVSIPGWMAEARGLTSYAVPTELPDGALDFLVG